MAAIIGIGKGNVRRLLGGGRARKRIPDKRAEQVVRAGRNA